MRLGGGRSRGAKRLDPTRFVFGFRGMVFDGTNTSKGHLNKRSTEAIGTSIRQRAPDKGCCYRMRF